MRLQEQKNNINILKEETKDVINKIKSSWSDVIEYLDESFLNDKLKEAINSYDLSSGVNPALYSEFYILEKMYLNLCDQIRNGNIDIEIILLDKLQYIENKLITKYKIKDTKLCDQALEFAIENFDGEKDFNSYILCTIRQAYKENTLDNLKKYEKVIEPIISLEEINIPSIDAETNKGIIPNDVEIPDINSITNENKGIIDDIKIPDINEYELNNKKGIIDDEILLPDIDDILKRIPLEKSSMDDAILKYYPEYNASYLDKLFSKYKVYEMIDTQDAKYIFFIRFRFNYYNKWLSTSDCANILDIDINTCNEYYKKCLLALKELIKCKVIKSQEYQNEKYSFKKNN